MINLNELQSQLKEWEYKNFGRPSISQLIMGMTEEVGETARYHLKAEQSIREGAIFTDSEIKDHIANSIVDTMIYGINLLTELGYPLEETLHEVSKRVMARDWNADPTGSMIR